MTVILRPLVLMWHTSTIIPRFLEDLSHRDLYLGYDSEIPDFEACYWMSGRYAARLHVAGIKVDLIAPGAHWLGNVDPALLGREIHVAALQDLPNGLITHVKPAQLKIEELPAGIYATEQYHAVAARLGVCQTSLVQWTETILDLNHEHRFYVLDGEIVTGSPYLVDGQVYALGVESPQSANALSFAQEALTHLGTDIPPACTLDVGLDQHSGKWVIVEANPAWSSGMYGAEMSAVIATIDRSCLFDERWAWQPDSDLTRQAEQMPGMTSIPVENSTSILRVNK